MIWYRSNNESCESSDTEDLAVDFEQLINQAENAEKKLVKYGNCECNFRYNHLSNFRHSRLTDLRAK